LKNHGRAVKGIFVHDEIGFNFSFTEMQAALGISQMRKLPAVIAKKQRIYDLYRDRLSCIDSKMIPIPIEAGVSPVHWFTSFLTEDKDALMAFMKDRGVQTRLFFYPLHMQPCYANTPYHKGEFPNSKRAYEMGISLPSSYGLSESDQHRVIDTILEFYR
jgi:perosamine synthetase